MGTATLIPDVDCPATPRAASAAELSPPLARDLVTRLARAVQRATIYPARHPNVRLAVSPLVEALRALPVAEVLVGFTSDRVFIGTNHRDAAPFDLPWMSARLSARGLSSLRINPRIAPDEAERLIVWLAGTDDLLSADDLPVFDGAVVARVDFAAVRFRDEPPEEAAGSPAELAWHAVSRLLAEGWAVDWAGNGPVDAAELASRVRDAIELREGTGVKEIGDRLVAAGAQLVKLPADVQATVKARLAAFVTALSPELRGQLLTVSPGDDPAKLSLLGDLVDRLPTGLVLEVIQGAELVRGSSSRQFLSFMMKLASLAATEPQLAEAFECRCSAAGLPRDLAYFETPQLRRILEDLLESRPDDAPMIAPEGYQQRLEQISASSMSAAVGYDADRHASATDTSVLARQSARVSLYLLEGEGLEPPDQGACLDRLLAALPLALDAWDADLLAAISDVAARISRTEGLAATVVEKATATLAWFERPAMLDAVIARLEDADGEPSTDLVLMARAGGLLLAEAVLTRLARLARTSPSAGRARLSRALDWLEPDTVRAALAEAYRKAPAQARALLAALADGGAAWPAAEAAQLFLGDEDPLLRLEAYRVLFAAHVNTPRWKSAVQKGLEDTDARVLHLSIDEAGSRTRVGVWPLAAFLDRRGTAAVAAAHLRAVGVLAAMDAREARQALRAALAARRMRWDAASRRVAAAIADALAPGGSHDDEVAIRRWRRSPAGWLTWLFGRGRAA